MATVLAALLAITSVGADTNHFDPGYCTWDAAEQAHTAWGIFPPWYGDAGDWAQGARESGWQVSTRPQVGSIMVLPRGDQGSGALGHVAWVLGIEEDGTTVDVRSMNWRGRGVVSLHQLVADDVAVFVTPPKMDDIGVRVGYTLQSRRGVEQW
ncbi:MAG: CHAP domain-containing protein [Chloroflexi bacterium]|nr:CHAP domain-containing protein [Chloroflexota bacterium]